MNSCAPRPSVAVAFTPETVCNAPSSPKGPVHEKDSASLSGSLDAEPSRITMAVHSAPAAKVLSSPAFATGACPA
jgi:hypothetical protein